MVRQVLEDPAAAVLHPTGAGGRLQVLPRSRGRRLLPRPPPTFFPPPPLPQTGRQNVFLLPTQDLKVELNTEGTLLNQSILKVKAFLKSF